jgi:hypothetical protein
MSYKHECYFGPSAKFQFIIVTLPIISSSFKVKIPDIEVRTKMKKRPISSATLLLNINFSEGYVFFAKENMAIMEYTLGELTPNAVDEF